MAESVFVTGGSGAVGSALVRRFAGAGWRTAFSYNRSAERAAELEDETGARGYRADLTDPASVAGLCEAVLSDYGEIGALINNAGRTQVMPFALIEPEDWDEVIGANLKTMYLVTKEFARGMISRKSGSIVNLGSLAGHRILEVPVHYATAKAGVTGFTLSLARELSRYGIRVNEVVPGLLSDGVGRMVPQKELDEYVNYNTSGRIGEPSEVADLVYFLCTDEARYINAQSIFIDGGI